MTRNDLISKIKQRKQEINITLENLAKISGIGFRTLNRLMAGDDVKLSSVEKVTNVLGLDFAGNETISLEKLKENRARDKAIFLASLVQSTSALEMQGLEESSLEKIIHNFQDDLLKGKYQDRLWVA